MADDPAIELPIGVPDLQGALAPQDAAAIAKGAVDGEDLWYEFVTLEDDRVRPAHAALHGSVWRVGDPNAPVPPLDYGCRCSMRYLAPTARSPAAKVLPVATSTPVPQVVVYGGWLVDRLKVSPATLAKWSTDLEKVPAADRQGEATLLVQDRLRRLGEPGNLTDARPLAQMLLALQQPGV